MIICIIHNFILSIYINNINTFILFIGFINLILSINFLYIHIYNKIIKNTINLLIVI